MKMSPGHPTRLVQLTHPDEGRRAALVYDNELHLLATYRSVYSFARAAIDTGWKLRDLLSTDLSGVVLSYDEIYSLATPWRFLPSFDHPIEPGRCLVSSAGATPRTTWNYQGSGASLYGHGEPIPVVLPGASPATPGDLAAVYVIGPDRAPRRVGVTPGNRSRFSSIGPELTLEADLPSVEGCVRVIRKRRKVWEEMLTSAGAPLLLALAAIEPDHFESADYRQPGDAHVHFFGDRFFGAREGTTLKDGDEVVVEYENLGRALRNPIQMEQPAARRVAAVPL
jgi:hypothetical protein